MTKKFCDKCNTIIKDVTYYELQASLIRKIEDIDKKTPCGFFELCEKCFCNLTIKSEGL